MKPEIKKAWVEALRSGEYEQGIGALCGEDQKYCCLGVLYDVGIAGYWYQAEWGEWMTAKRDTDALSEYLDRLGLPDDLQNELIHMNDCGKPFSEIADFIEAHL